LSFSTDDIIDILNETNEDWWEGRCNGRVGLFPSNHVEKVASHGFPAPSTHAPPALTGEKFTSHIPTPNYQPQYITPSPGPAYTPSPHSGQTPHVTNTAQATVVIHEQPKTSKPKRHLFHGGFGSSVRVPRNLSLSICNLVVSLLNPPWEVWGSVLVGIRCIPTLYFRSLHLQARQLVMG
jgi:hypothetical protein